MTLDDVQQGRDNCIYFLSKELLNGKLRMGLLVLLLTGGVKGGEKR